MKFCAAIVLGLLALLSAAHAADSPAMKTYIHMKQDSDLFLGEGLAEKKDFDGNAAKALEAAQSRAKGALAEAIKVRISSQTSETLSSKDGKVTEDIKSQTQSQADVSLENIKFMEFTDFPEAGQMTVLATVTKEDYRRQLAGKGPRVYRPEHGLRLIYVATTTFAFEKLVGDENKKRYSGIPFKPGHAFGSPTSNNSSPDGNAESLQGLGLEFRFRDWSLCAEMGLAPEIRVVPYDPADGLYGGERGALETLTASLGYDWTPWAWRVQPYLPLALRYTHVSLAHHAAWASAASAGLGLRYWPNDSLAFDFSGRYIQGLTNAALMQGGKPLYLGPGKPAELSLNGAQWQVSLLWSGF